MKKWSDGVWSTCLPFMSAQYIHHILIPGLDITLASFVCVCVCVCVCTQMLSHVRLFVSPWTVAHQAPLSMGFSRHECWSGLPFLLQGIFPTQGSPVSPALAGRFFTHWAFCADSLTGSRTFTKAPSRRHPSSVVFPHLAGVESAGGLVSQGI